MQDTTASCSQPEIALLLHSPSGGVGRVTQYLAKELLRLGWKVDLLIGSDRAADKLALPLELEQGLRRVVSLSSKFKLYRAIPGLVSYLRKHSPQVLLAMQSHANVLASIASYFPGLGQTSIILRESNTISLRRTYSKGLNRLQPRLAAWLYGRADGIIAVSHGVAEDLHRVTRIPLGRIHVVLNPIDVEMVRLRALEPNEHGWLQGGRDYPVVLGVGGLVKRKGFDTLLRSMAKVHEHLPVRLIVLGDGPERGSLVELAGMLGLHAWVSFPGWVSNPWTYMARADVFVLASNMEGCPNVLVEALAVGTRVVSTDCPSGPAEILDGGTYGELVPTRDPEALAMGIKRALTRGASGDANSWIERFALERQVREYRRVIASIQYGRGSECVEG